MGVVSPLRSQTEVISGYPKEDRSARLHHTVRFRSTSLPGDMLKSFYRVKYIFLVPGNHYTCSGHAFRISKHAFQYRCFRKPIGFLLGPAMELVPAGKESGGASGDISTFSRYLTHWERRTFQVQAQLQPRCFAHLAWMPRRLKHHFNIQFLHRRQVRNFALDV